jgi:hypothetical protein
VPRRLWISRLGKNEALIILVERDKNSQVEKGEFKTLQNLQTLKSTGKYILAHTI